MSRLSSSVRLASDLSFNISSTLISCRADPRSFASPTETLPGGSRLSSVVLTFGSNFPIEKLWTSYGELIAAHRAAVAGLSPNARAAVFRDTAARVYRLAS